MANEAENIEKNASTDDVPVSAGRGKKKRLIILGVVFALLLSASLAIGVVARVGFTGVMAALTTETDPATDSLPSGSPSAVPLDAVLELDEMIVNITGTTLNGRKTSRFLKIKLAITYKEPPAAEGQPKFEPLTKEIFLRDAFQDYLRQVDEVDLTGTRGMLTLKSELLKRAELTLGPNIVTGILISDLVVQ